MMNRLRVLSLALCLQELVAFLNKKLSFSGRYDSKRPSESILAGFHPEHCTSKNRFLGRVGAGRVSELKFIGIPDMPKIPWETKQENWNILHENVMVYVAFGRKINIVVISWKMSKYG